MSDAARNTPTRGSVGIRVTPEEAELIRHALSALLHHSDEWPIDGVTNRCAWDYAQMLSALADLDSRVHDAVELARRALGGFPLETT